MWTGAFWLMLTLAAAPAPTQGPAVTSVDFHYRDPRTGIEFDPPEGWSWGGLRNSGHDTSYGDGTFTIYAYMNQEMPVTQKQLDAANSVAAAGTGPLEPWMESMTHERAAQGYPKWQLRTDSVRSQSINGRPAIVAIADWGAPFPSSPTDLEPRVEYLIQIRGLKSLVRFFGSTRPGQFEELQENLDLVAQSAKVP